MKIKIINNISYQTYPITDDMIDIDENILKEIGKTKQFDNGIIVDYVCNETELTMLKNWFSNDYTYKEQKYRRLHTLGITENGKSAYDLLIELYKEAETKRKRIQELGG